ncbi:hydrolase [Pseudomassariella vexata]|uniref:Hydrolase n=1 Tax=Pseudomassariella vexata TaxID=1141098 RepID=A0A1Y2DUV4_9PEZI|nr:hydrolase [Pseudomassariella vexata]ORY63038.1 hydrolase [Pseudomassariella vexata]
MAAVDSSIDEKLVRSVTAYVKDFMAKYDGSHDFAHIQRVLGIARYIHSRSPTTPALDSQVVVLSALLHDVGDKKYLKPDEDASTMVFKLLVSLGADEQLAQKVQTVCLGVSYSSEIKNPMRVQELIKAHPELAVVQDADRLDAIGGVGIGRAFTFGGARSNRPMDETVEHFEQKLLRLEGMMKTDVGRELAKERTERMALFRKWWDEETAFANMSPVS